MSDVPHVVVVGGGFGGLEVAKQLSDVPVRVTLVDRSNHHLFQPLLYQVAMAGVSPADIAIPIRSVLRRCENVSVVMAEVTDVDRTGKRIEIDRDQWLEYDYLVVAAGAKTNYFGNDHWGSHALGLKTLDDAIEIRRRVLLAFEAAEREDDDEVRSRLLTFIVIGGGPTGVEIAGSVAELSRFVLANDFRKIATATPRVLLIEATESLLGPFDERLRDSAKEQLEDLGVEVVLGTMVRDIRAGEVELDDRVLEATNIFWTAGVRARRLSGRLDTELDRSGRVVVTDTCSLPEDDRVFCIGDMARFDDPESEQPLPGIAPVALQQGRYVAEAIRTRIEGGKPEPFRYRDKGMMATIGRSRAVAQSGGMRLTGLMAWLAWLVVHIWFLIGFRNRAIVVFQWAWSYFTYKRGARLITGERAWERVLSMAERSHPEGGSEPAPRASGEAK